MSSTKFKVGDKVRNVSADHVMYSDAGFPIGAVAEVLGESDLGLIRLKTSVSVFVYVRSIDIELVTEETELEELVRKANEGVEAIRTIRKKYRGQVQYLGAPKSSDEGRYVNFSEWSFDYLDWNPQFRIKPKPAFEPFYVGPRELTGDAQGKVVDRPAWLVKLEGDTLHAGCIKVGARWAKETLEYFKTGSGKRTYRGLINVQVFRGGLKVETPDGVYELNWADADHILKALEDAGVK